MLCTFEHALSASNPEPPQRSDPDPPRHLRGSVTGFSSASRRRLLRLLSTVRTSRLPPARFVTLTWHRVPENWHANALAFRQWLRRRSALYLWRLEAQERGAPHFHLLVWCADWNEAEARAAWSRIAAHGSRAHAEHGYHETELHSYGQAFAYASKYAAKRDRELPEELQGHRVWGASRDLPTSATGASDRLSVSQYYTLRRFARGLLRARARRSGRGRSRRGVSPASLWLFLRAGDSERIARWLGVELLDPLWTRAHDHERSQAFGASNTPNAPPPRLWRGQYHLDLPHGARLN